MRSAAKLGVKKLRECWVEKQNPLFGMPRLFCKPAGRFETVAVPWGRLFSGSRLPARLR